MRPDERPRRGRARRGLLLAMDPAPTALAPAPAALVRGPCRRLEDLGFLVGSRCNLSCIHCYVGSSPTSDTLEALSADEVLPFPGEARALGVGHIYLSGGEPFVNRQCLEILEACTRTAPTTVPTNAVGPIGRRVGELGRRRPGRLAFRVSFDHYREERHDAIRGEGSFREAADQTVRLAREGFRPIVTTTAEVFRGNPVAPERALAAFRDLFAARGVEVDVKLLPAVLPMGAQRSRVDGPGPAVAVTEATLRASGVRPASLMYATGRSVLKIDSRVRVYPCPIIYDVPSFDLGGSLGESPRVEVPLAPVGCSTYCVTRQAGRCTDPR
ncbi:MAG: radical SAM protein [Planctomycetes bacterium]|nr:radical SAM protein [Planctomycetota bacterium]